MGEEILDHAVTDLREILCGKDSKKTYDLFVQLERQAGESPELFSQYPLYLEMLENRSSFIRVRGFRMLCAAAGWDETGVLADNLPQILRLLEDEKPTAVRQCLAALPALITGRPELKEAVREKVGKLDFSAYKDTMKPLLLKDAEDFLRGCK